jgi:hypothetical protein
MHDLRQVTGTLTSLKGHVLGVEILWLMAKHSGYLVHRTAGLLPELPFDGVALLLFMWTAVRL